MYGMVGTQSSATTKHSTHRRVMPQPSSSALQTTNVELDENGERRDRSVYHRFMSCIKQTWTGVKTSDELEFDDLDSPTYRRPTKSLDHLVAITHFSRLEIKRLYRAFKAECPTGLIREDTFRAMYSQFFPKGAIGSQYSHYVFNSLAHHDQSGTLGFEDIVLVMSDLCRGTVDKKLRWAFHIYDVDGDGAISRTELEEVVLSIHQLMGEVNADPVVATANSRLWAERIFKKMDLNDDGSISFEEFLTVCLQDDEIRRSLTIFADVY